MVVVLVIHSNQIELTWHISLQKMLHVQQYVCIYLVSRDYLNCSHRFVREFTIQPSNVHPLSKYRKGACTCGSLRSIFIHGNSCGTFCMKTVKLLQCLTLVFLGHGPAHLRSTTAHAILYVYELKKQSNFCADNELEETDLFLSARNHLVNLENHSQD